MKKGKRRIKLGMRVGELIDIPLESFGDTLKVCVIADSLAWIENYDGVFECAENVIRLRTGSGIVRVDGEELVLSELRCDRAVIKGSIKAVQFEN